MHTFPTNNREELIARCKLKVAERPRRADTAQQLANGVPLFLDQLTRTLEAEDKSGAKPRRMAALKPVSYSNWLRARKASPGGRR